jgi:hypothetical protein
MYAKLKFENLNKQLICIPKDYFAPIDRCEQIAS